MNVLYYTTFFRISQLFSTKCGVCVWYFFIGDSMKVKIYDEENEIDLEEKINDFIFDKEVIDIKYQVAIAVSGEEQIYCYSAIVIYN